MQDRASALLQLIQARGGVGDVQECGEGIRQYPHCAVTGGGEPFAFDTEPGAAGEGLIEANSCRFKLSARDQTGAAFRYEAAEGLVKTGDLRGFEADAVVEEKNTNRKSTSLKPNQLSLFLLPVFFF